MSDVGACSEDDRVALWLLVVVMQQFCDVENLVEKRDPAVVVRVVLGNFLGNVVVAQFVGSWVAFCLVLIQTSLFLGSRRWNSSSHLI